MIEFINKYKWWILATIIIIAIIIILWKRKPTKAPASEQSEWTSTGATASGGGGGLSSTKCQQQSVFPLKIGSTGKQVGALQKFINSVPSSTKLTVDCDFGAKTEANVLAGIGTKEVSLGAYKAYNIYKFES